MNIEKALREYREKNARIEILSLEIEGIQEDIKRPEGIKETDADTIEGMTFRRSLDGSGGQPDGSKTERVAIQYNDEQDKISRPKHIDYLYQKLRQKQNERRWLQDETRPMRIALNGLSDRERLVIDERYVSNNSWYIVAVQYKDRFGVYISERTCKNIKNQAFSKLRRILGVKQDLPENCPKSAHI